MGTNNAKEKINIRSVLILSLVSLVLSLVSIVLGPQNIIVSIIPIGISSGILASLIHFECERTSLPKIITPIAIILIDWIFNGFYSLVGIIIVVSALMIFLVYEQGFSKFESSIAMSLIVALMIVLLFLAIGSRNDQGITAIEYYKNLYEQFKTEYIAQFNEIYLPIYEAAGVNPIPNEEMIYALDYAVALLISMLFAVGFVLIGIASKVYSIVMNKLGSDIDKLARWKFMPTTMFAYFYVIVEFLTMFSGSELTTFNLSVANLSAIFMIIFLYYGFVAIGKLIKERRKRGMPIMFTIVCAIVLVLVFPRIISYAGVFYCIVGDKIKNMKDSNTD